jgi:hypothetical protein
MRMTNEMLTPLRAIIAVVVFAVGVLIGAALAMVRITIVRPELLVAGLAGLEIGFAAFPGPPYRLGTGL